MGGEIIDSLELDAKRGGEMFRDGKPSPEYPGDEAWGRNRQSAEWLGYHVARFDEYWKRRRAMEMLGIEDTD